MMRNDHLTPLISPYELETSSTRHQILAIAGAVAALVATGNSAGFPAVALPSFVGPLADIEASKDDLSWIASMVTIGCITGNILGGVTGDLIGRKKSIMLGSFIFSIGWIVIAESPNVAAILSGRILTGLAAGLVASPVQVYICEIAAPSIRGASGSAPSLMVTFGILSMYCIGSLVQWRMVALISAITPLLVLFYVLIVLPESPTWLVAKGMEREAMKSLSWLRESSEESLEEFIALQDLKESRLEINPRPNRNFQLSCRLNRFRDWSVIKPFLIGATLFFLQAFCGIFPITCYTTLIFRYADHFLNDYLQTVCIGVIRMISIFGAIFLVKYFRRRTLLMTSATIMFLANGVLATYFHVRESQGNLIEGGIGGNLNSSEMSLSPTFVDATLPFHDFTMRMVIGELSLSLEWVPMTCLVVFMLGYTCGFGVIPWFLMAEMMPSDVRSLSCSIAYAFGQLCLFVSVKTFLDLVEMVGADGTFWIYSSMALASLFFVGFFVPETANLSDQEIADIFKVRKKRSKKSRNK